MDLTQIFISFVSSLDPLTAIAFTFAVYAAGRMGWIDITNRLNKNKKPNLLITLAQIRTLGKKQQRLEFDIVHEQMEIMEEFTSHIKTFLRESYHDKLEEHGISRDRILEGKEAHWFNILVDLLEYRLKDHLRSIVRENNFNRMNEHEFHAYTLKRFSEISTIINDYFMRYYSFDEEITKLEILKMISNCKKELCNEWTAKLRFCKHASHENEMKIRKIDFEICKNMKQLNGEDEKECDSFLHEKYPRMEDT